MAPVNPNVAAGRAAVGGLYNEQKAIKADYDAAESQFKAAQKKVDDLMQGFARGTPPPFAQLKEAADARNAAEKKRDGLVQKYGAAMMQTHLKQDEVLKLQTAGQKGVKLDSVEDAASLTPAEQTKLLGAPVAFDQGKAVEGDGKRVSIAMKAEAKNGAQMLAFQLEGADEKYQVDLVKRSAKNVKAMANAANADPATAKALMDLLGKAKGPARAELLKIVAAQLPSTSHETQQWLETTGRGQLIKQLRADVKKGDNLDVAADLIGALQAAKRPNEAGDVISITADGLQALRSDFEKANNKVNDLNAHLARLAGGFGEALGSERSQAAMKAFQDKHAKDYAKLDDAAAKYLKVKDVVTRLPRVTDGDDLKFMKMLREAGNPFHIELNRNQRMEDELARFGDNLQDAVKTRPGKAVLEKALTDQLAGKQNFISDFVAGAKTNKELKDFVADKLPNLVAVGVGHLALKTDSAGLKKLLASNAGLLGLNQEGLEKFSGLADKLSKAKTPTEVNSALGTLRTENYSPALKKLGGLLALPGALEALGTTKDKNLLENVKAAIDGVEVLAALSDSKVLEAVSKKLGPAAMALGVGIGLGKLFEGKIAEGSADVMAGVGALMMTSGRLAALVPGGQLIGAALVAGSFIVGLFQETESEKAERAAQGDAKTYLKGGGLSDAAATALGNLRESDHRDVGGFINQIAPKVGMTNAQLLDHLSKLDPDDLRAFTEMVLQMPTDKTGKYKTEKQIFDSPYTMHAPMGPAYGPKSLDTAVQWMKHNGIVPKDARPL